jgi:predicted dehydrogenase
MNRRDFLKRGGLALAACVAAPTIIPASALGRDGAIAPSNRICMGFIGIGGQGGGHLFGGAWTYVAGGYLGRDEVQVQAVCDVWKDRRESAKQRVNEHYASKSGQGSYKGCEAYTDFRQILERPDIDAVLIATPIHWHAMMTIMAAKAGKDVYCEKPSALTIEQGQAAVAAVTQYGRVFQAGTQQRSEYGGKFRQACELVRNGRIGTLREVYSYRGGGCYTPEPWPASSQVKAVPPDLDWDLFLGPANWMPYAGSCHAHMFGTEGMNWGQHHLDIVQWTLDADRTGPVEMTLADGAVHWHFANGVVVHGCPYPGEAVGSDGGACFVGTEGRINVDRDNLIADRPRILSEPLGPEAKRVYHSTSHSGNFLECIRTRQQTICDIETAHRAASMLLLGGLALQLGRRLQWDPQAERFINDDEANRLLAISTRTPWRV